MVNQGGKLQLPIWRFELSVEKKVVINGDVHVHTEEQLIIPLKVIPLISLTTYVSAGQSVHVWHRGCDGHRGGGESYRKRTPRGNVPLSYRSESSSQCGRSAQMALTLLCKPIEFGLEALSISV